MAPSSTADHLPLPAVVDLAQRRRSEIIWFIRASISPDEAEAMASPGYKPSGRCGDCMRKNCPSCDVDPAEQVRGGGRQRSADPRFVTAILNRTAFTDPAILKRALPALAGLPPDERWVLLLELGAGWGQQQIAVRLKVSRQTVGRLKDRGLDRLVLAVWG